MRGVRPLAPSLDIIGPMAKDVSRLIKGMQLQSPVLRLLPDLPIASGAFGWEKSTRGSMPPSTGPCSRRPLCRCLRHSRAGMGGGDRCHQ